MTDNEPTYIFRLGDSSPVLLAPKAQLSRLGAQVGDVDSPEFDRQFESAIKNFQQRRGLYVDGVLGPDTFGQIERARYKLGDRVLRFDPVLPLVGDDVGRLQRMLSGLGLYMEPNDLEFGSDTDAAVRDLQKGLGLSADGIVGPATLKGLAGIVRNDDLSSAYPLREKARVNAMGPEMTGRLIIIEAATSRQDFPTTLFTREERELEARFVGDIAHRLDGKLSAVGAGTILRVVDPHEFEERSERQEKLPDELNANLVVSITNDVSLSEKPNGVATYYYGASSHPAECSPVGLGLASLIQKEITARTDFLDCRSHPRTWPSLRRIRAPKVHVIPGYVSNAEDRARLEDPEVRDAIAQAIAVSIQRLYFTPEIDPPTGTLDLSSIRGH